MTKRGHVVGRRTAVKTATVKRFVDHYGDAFDCREEAERSNFLHDAMEMLNAAEEFVPDHSFENPEAYAVLGFVFDHRDEIKKLLEAADAPLKE